jgi:hypothetical protein
MTWNDDTMVEVVSQQSPTSMSFLEPTLLDFPQSPSASYSAETDDYDPCNPQYIVQVSPTEAKRRQAGLLLQQIGSLKYTMRRRLAKRSGEASNETEAVFRHYEKVLADLHSEMARIATAKNVQKCDDCEFDEPDAVAEELLCQSNATTHVRMRASMPTKRLVWKLAVPVQPSLLPDIPITSMEGGCDDKDEMSSVGSVSTQAISGIDTVTSRDEHRTSSGSDTEEEYI